jgi:gas vesicle protein
MAETPERSDSWGSLAAGMLIGIAIGATLSLLYAPKPGKALRDDIGEKLEELKDYVDQTTQQVTQVAKERLAEMQSDLTTAMESARAAAAEHAAELSRRVKME